MMEEEEVEEPEQVRHWSGSGPVQVEQVEWQATHSADDVERYNLGMETNQSMWDQDGFKMQMILRGTIWGWRALRWNQL